MRPPGFDAIEGADERSRVSTLIEHLTDLYVDWISHADLTRLMPFGVGKANPEEPARAPRPARPGQAELAGVVQGLRAAKPLRRAEGGCRPALLGRRRSTQRHTGCDSPQHHGPSFASNPGEVRAASPRSCEPASANGSA